MTATLTFLAVAEQDIQAAVLWYDQQRPGLGDIFIADLQEILEHIRLQPEMYRRIDGPVRRAVLHRFPYSVLYRILTDELEVVAVLHFKLHPGKISSRLRTEGNA